MTTVPDLGINALEAIILTFSGLNARRMNLRSDARVHGIITNGGSAVNVIPDLAVARFSVRARDRAYQRELIAILRGIAEGAASITGATLEFAETRGYENMVTNRTIAAVFGEQLSAVGRVVEEPGPGDRLGSTDMADISQIMPAVHAYLAISPEGVANHTPAFTTAAGSPTGDAAVIDGAKAMAMTALELLGDPTLLERANAEFQEQRGRGRVAGRDAWLEHGKEFAPVRRGA